jgi:peptidoglycan/LPS O-acetylase OafA/YrhL
VGLGGIFAFGYVGVDFFFVLSGFIITYVHHHELGRATALPRYLWRRFSRIFPIYWFVLLLAIGATTAARYAAGKPAAIDLHIADLPGTVFLLMPFHGPMVEPKYIGVAWTLQFEVLFYLAFCVVLLHRRLGLGLLAVWAAYLLAQIAGLVNVALPLQLDSAHCLQFLLGVGVALLARSGTLNGKLLASRKMLVLAVLTFAAAVVFEMTGPQGLHSDYGRLALGLAAAMVLATLTALEQSAHLATLPNTNAAASPIRPLACPNWLVKFGSASYSVYLAHILLASITYTVLLRLGLYHRLPEVAAYGIALVVALGGATAIGYLVELPTVAWLKERTRRK